MAQVREWSRTDAARLLRAPSSDDDKYSRGVVALRTGSAAYPGAAVLGVEACWRTGAGFVRYVGEGRAADAVIARRPETVTGPDVGSTRIDAWVIGSGTDAAARSAEETEALRQVLAGAAPVVIDAGALDLALGARAPFLVTPHAGEFARLRAQLRQRPEGSGDRVRDALETAAALGGTVLLKGAHTIIANQDGEAIEVDAGTGWLATAGTGDVLAGVLGALIAANLDKPLAEVAAAGAWLHGYAARLASGTAGAVGQHGRGKPIVALDVAEALPRAVGDLLS